MNPRRFLTPLISLPVLMSSAHAEEDTIYAKVVQPILAARCVECHGEEKAKGKLRLDTPEHILKGGSEGETVIAGDSEESSLVFRVTLPEDDDELMPPKGDPLTPDQIEALKWWIDKKEASFEAKFVIAEAPDAVKKLAENAPVVVQKKATEPELPEVDPANPESMKPLQDMGVLVLPLAQNTNLLHVESVSVAKDVKDEHLALLEPLAPQLAWLYLNKTQITDAGLKHLAGMKQLRRLHLANTAITDAGVKHLAGLENLETLNIYGTKVSNAVLETVASLPKLKKVFLYDTQVEPRAAFRFLNQHPDLDVNLGWDFESLKNLDSGLAYQETFDDQLTGSAQGGKIDYADGVAAKAATFDGKAYVVAGDVGNFDHSDAFSVAAWIKGEPQDDGVIAARADVADAGRGWTFHVSKGQVGFQLVSNGPDNAIKVHAPAEMDKDTWYYVAATYDGSGKAEGVKLYVDSLPVDVKVGQDNLSRTTKTFQGMHLGRRSDGAIFKGQMDDFRLYPTALSSDQLGALFDRYDHKAVPGESASTEDAKNGQPEGVALVGLFDDGSCCAKAHGKGEACDHACCVKAAEKETVCLKCNPGAKEKLAKGVL